MILFLALLHFSFSTLQRGEDPYAILGISRDATAQQIKSAFRKIVFDHHPDRHKTDESYKIWLRANDAYEILSDPQRKLRFDQDGSVSEDPPPPSREYYTGYTAPQATYHTPLITHQLFPYLARDGSEWIIFVFQNFDCPSCSQQMQVFESVADKIKEYVKVARLDANQAPQMVDDLKVTTLPQYVSVKLINGTIHSKKLGSKFSSESDALKVFFSHWKSKVSHLKRYSDVENWLKIKENFVHAVEFVKKGEESSIHFNFASTTIQNTVFATVSVDSSEVKYDLPTVLIYRGSDSTPIIVSSKGRKMIDEIDDLSTPLFPLLTYNNIQTLCKDWCIAQVNEVVNETLIHACHQQPFNTGRLSPSSQIVRKLKLETNQWIVISQNRVWKIGPVQSSNHFIVLCSDLYRADNVESVMKKSEFAILKSVDYLSMAFLEILLDHLPFELTGDTFYFIPLNITIPTPIIIAAIPFLVILLFLFGLNEHTIVKNEINTVKPEKAEKDIKKVTEIPTGQNEEGKTENPEHKEEEELKESETKE